MKLSRDAQYIYNLLRERYINNGYTGDYYFLINEICFKRNANLFNSINELIKLNIIQKRNCLSTAYELTENIRKELLIKYNLKEKWKKENDIYPFIYWYNKEIELIL